ncbi:unnamed protein product [Musa hybrid cultivar]
MCPLPLPPTRGQMCFVCLCSCRRSAYPPLGLHYCYIFLPSGVPGMLVVLSFSKKSSIFALTKKILGLTQ